VDRNGVVDLVAAIVRGAPSLPEAACVGQYQLFDDVPGRQSRDQRQQRYEAAVMVCRGCPTRPACSESLFKPTW
jgi:hypothetical protein